MALIGFPSGFRDFHGLSGASPGGSSGASRPGKSTRALLGGHCEPMDVVEIPQEPSEIL